MFNADKDEHLVAVNHRAGFIAFFVTQGLLLAALFIDTFLNAAKTVDHTLLMFLPWFIGIWVYVILLIRWGYLAAVREENTREFTRDAAQRRRVRIGVVVEMLFFGAIMFAFKRLFPGPGGADSIEADAIGSAVAGLVFGLLMWWTSARMKRWWNPDSAGKGKAHT
jgi:hypothetical protein